VWAKVQEFVGLNYTLDCVIILDGQEWLCVETMQVFLQMAGRLNVYTQFMLM
jgi:hypothetical protein